MLLRVSIPVETGNAAARAGTLGSTVEKILADLKPEAAYFFADDNGNRSGSIVFDMKDSSEIPGIAEPWFLAFNSKVSFRPVMSPQDLAKAGPSIGEAAKQYGKWRRGAVPTPAARHERRRWPCHVEADIPQWRLIMKALLCAILFALASSLAMAVDNPAARPSLPQMSAWVDPTEHAFTVNVPAGWRITGGTHRNAPIDARNYVQAESPDGKIRVFVDDPNILPHQEPNPMYYRLGWYEGRTVQTQVGPLMIERFETGARFAQDFTGKRMCSAPQGLSAFDLPQETRRMTSDVAGAAARAGVRALPSAGEFVYRCGDRFGYTYAVTVIAYGAPGGPRTWAVYKLAGYLADKSAVEVARYVMNAMRVSFTLDPGWQAQYERQIHDTTGALMEISNRLTADSIRQAQQSLQQNMAQVQRRQQQFDQMSKASMDSFHRQQASQDQIRQRWSDITLGQIHGCDDLGNCQEVSNDYDYYWTKDGKTVVGGPSDGSPPGPEYHKWTPDY
jgi:uncharacterized protein YbdZ (MbtH family)